MSEHMQMDNTHRYHSTSMTANGSHSSSSGNNGTAPIANTSHHSLHSRSVSYHNNDLLPKRLEPLHHHHHSVHMQHSNISYERLNRRSNGLNDNELQVHTSTATPTNANASASPTSINKVIAHSPPQQLSPSSSLASLDGHYYESDTDSPITSVRSARSFSVETRTKAASSFDFAVGHSNAMHRQHKNSYDHDMDTDMRWSSRSPSQQQVHQGVLFLVGRRLEFESQRAVPLPITFKSLNDFITNKLLPQGAVYKLAGCDGMYYSLSHTSYTIHYCHANRS
jgi:hypothetical protein